MLFSYPDPNLPYRIQIDAYDNQVGAIIYNKPVAFFSHKLNPAQQCYPQVTKRPCIQECSILYCAEIIIKMDHKNLVQDNIKTSCLLHWHLLIGQFVPKLVYICGEGNAFADQLGCLLLIVPKETRIQPDNFKILCCITLLKLMHFYSSLITSVLNDKSDKMKSFMALSWFVSYWAISLKLLWLTNWQNKLSHGTIIWWAMLVQVVCMQHWICSSSTPVWNQKSWECKDMWLLSTR